MRASFVVPLVIACLSSACGGSASETPFPIEPARATLTGGADAGPSSSVVYQGSDEETPESDDLGDDGVGPGAPAKSTWGTRR
ncbi:MAG: hypothetical protein KC776_30355 [Myxococcales bacterium]|nr:hypothetical protein [Myxococcales bacterium]MCB9579040.1 hypothetical protein [Polyangiaceae bacterium]